MSHARRFTSTLAFASLLLFVTVAALRAQDATEPSIENSKFQADGLINANAVYVRSGPSDNDYPVMKLDKGAQLHVVGQRFEWLKVVPPDGSFCYVSKAYVDRHGDGSQPPVAAAGVGGTAAQQRVLRGAHPLAGDGGERPLADGCCRRGAHRRML